MKLHKEKAAEIGDHESSDLSDSESSECSEDL